MNFTSWPGTGNHVPNLSSYYDGAGNLTNDGTGHTYAYDSEGRPTTVDGVQIAYDAFNRPVMQNRSGAYTEIVYAPTGQKFALMNGQTVQHYFVPMAGGLQAVFNGSGLQYWRHSDWLGSSRFASTPAGGVYYDAAYNPFGYAYNETGTHDRSFTGQTQDTTVGLTDFLFRLQNPSQGRWLVPDPSGLAAVDITNPQTWNRYAYVGNNPLNSTDPLGLCDYSVCVTAPAPPDLSYMNSLGGGGFGGFNRLEMIGDDKGGGGFSLLSALKGLSIGNPPSHTFGWLAGRTPANTQYALVRTFDCFAPGDARRSSTYSLAGQNGPVDSSDAVITEHQLNPDWQESSQAGGTFEDWIGPNGSAGQGSSVRYFTVSLGGQNLGVVPVRYGNGKSYAYEGIWMNGDVGQPTNTQVFVNGSQADTMKTEGGCEQ